MYQNTPLQTCEKNVKYYSDTTVQPLGKLQALPRNGQPVRDKRWGNTDNALHKVVGEIKDLIERQFA